MSTPSQDASYKVIAERSNIIYSTRESQMEINILGWHGGRDYVDARLSRFPGEREIDWSGSSGSGYRQITGLTRADGTKIDGRKQVSHVIPYLGRIVTKINQHVFGILPERKGATLEVLSDISSSGDSINQVMLEVNSYLTTCGWCWVGIDAPSIPIDTQISRAEKEQLKIRPYWQCYSPLSVVDWYINDTGIIQWVLTEGYDYIASDPYTAPAQMKYRKLWEPGKMTKFIYKADNQDKIESQEEVMLSVNFVPFVLAGRISSEAHGFDNLESINKTIMDLESCNRQNFYNSVFPQMKLPASVLDNVMNKFSVNAEQAVQMVMGYNYPILVGQDDADPGFIMPDGTCIGKMREELKELKNELFESTGLMLQQETRQVASAESKAWDYLDIRNLLKERATILEEVELKCVEMSHAWDSDFPLWEPKYNRSFDISNFKEEMEALIMASNVSMPQEFTQFVLRRIFELIKINGKQITEEEEKAIVKAIEGLAVEKENNRSASERVLTPSEEEE